MAISYKWKQRKNKKSINNYVVTSSDLIRPITKISDGSDEKYLKSNFNSDDELPLIEKIGISNMIIVVRAVFHENSKYYPQVFLDKCPCKMIVYMNNMRI